MHRLFVQERQLHIKRAAIYSREIRKYFAQKEAAQRPKTEIEQNARVEKEAKKHGAQISKMVKEFWKKANMLVDHGRKVSVYYTVMFVASVCCRKHSKLNDGGNLAIISTFLFPRPKSLDKWSMQTRTSRRRPMKTP